MKNLHISQSPTPNSQVMDIYWQFADKRLDIFYKRLNGQPAPWTDDPILSTYKFCNVYRAADRVSQYLIRDIIYDEQNAVQPADRIFQIVAFRFFSRESTWDYLTKYIGHQPTIADLSSGEFERALDDLADTDQSIFTNAFILCASSHFGRDRKYQNYVELFKYMFIQDDFAGRALACNSLAGLYDLLISYPMVGRFMAYQIAIDLNYSDLFPFSENDFTMAGPGARRGIAKVFTDKGSLSHEDIIHYMVDRQSEEFERLGIDFPGLFGRPLHAIDVQNLFCEVDKYTRVAMPQLASNRTNIKNKFTANGHKLVYKFPPKWGLSC